MLSPSLHSVRVALVLLALASITACETRHTEPPQRASAGGEVTGGTSSARPAATPGADSARGADTTSTPHGVALTSPHIFGIFDDANSTEITASGIAVEKAKSQAVKSFAARMIQDHRSLLHESRTLSSQLGITPQASSDSTLIKLQREMLDTLRTAPSGASFDSLYMATQVRMHQHAIEVVRSAAQAAPESQLRDLLNNALGMLQSHLRDAQRIQQGLSA